MPIESDALSDVYRALDGVKTTVQAMDTRHQVDMAGVQQAIIALKDDSRSILNVVRDGRDGDKPLILRTARLEDAVENLNSSVTMLENTVAQTTQSIKAVEQSVDDIKEQFSQVMAKLETIDRRTSSQSVAKMKIRWEFWALIIGGLLTSVASILTAIFK